jgi:hypothetical protein
MKQYDIKGEHLALVDQGRAGIAKIIDSKPEIFELHKYLVLPSKEKKDAFMQKISTEVLEGIKKYYYTNEEETFSPEEIEMTIKIVERELNNRTNSGMGLSEETKKQNKATDIAVPVSELKNLGYVGFKFIASHVPVYGNQKTNTVIIIDSKNKYAYKTNLIKEKDNTFGYENGTSVEFTQEEKEMLEEVGYSIQKMKEKSNDEELLGGLADKMSIGEIAEKHGISERVIRRQLQKGIKHEMEHTSDREKAKEIAMDHLYKRSDYYTKLSKMEEKAEDLYIEDDKITMNFEEEDLAWVTIMAKNVVEGDIISTIKSIRPFEVTEVIEKSGEIKLYLISTDENFQKTVTLDSDDKLDLLIISKTGEKVMFNDKKAEDARVLTQVKDLKKGDVTPIGGVKFKVTSVTVNDKGRYYVMSGKTFIYKDASGEDYLQQ